MLTIAPAQRQDAPIIERLLQFHLYECGAEPGQDGMIDWGEPMERFFTDPACVPLLFRDDDELVGFAFVKLDRRLASPDGQTPIAANLIEEFFILRSHRRKGLGTLATDLILDRYPGRWSVTTWPDTCAGASARFWHYLTITRSGLDTREFGPGDHKGFPGQYVWVVEPKRD